MMLKSSLKKYLKFAFCLITEGLIGNCRSEVYGMESLVSSSQKQVENDGRYVLVQAVTHVLYLISDDKVMSFNVPKEMELHNVKLSLRNEGFDELASSDALSKFLTLGINGEIDMKGRDSDLLPKEISSAISFLINGKDSIPTDKRTLFF